MTDQREPILIIGCDRSGTSIVTRILRELGLFVGWRLDNNYESPFFWRLNTWVLDGGGASRSWPTHIDLLETTPCLRSPTVEYLQFLVSSPRAIGFLGPLRYSRYRDLRSVAEPWGWKDPINTFTMPLWLEVFGGAKVIHVVRHPADVVGSMQTRFVSGLETDVRQFRRLRPIFTLRPKRSPFGSLPRYADHSNSWGLWTEYMDRARLMMDLVGDFGMQIRFEDLAADPHHALRALCEFCAIETTSDRVDLAASLLRRERSFAFRNDPALVELSRIKEAAMSEWGYSVHGYSAAPPVSRGESG